MGKFLIFLLILVILFGVEATRAFIFGAFGFIFWIAVAIIGFCLLINTFVPSAGDSQAEFKEKRARGVGVISGIVLFIVCLFNSVDFWTAIISCILVGAFMWLMLTPGTKDDKTDAKKDNKPAKKTNNHTNKK